MSVMDELRAASDKLTRLKMEGSPGPWELQPTDKHFNPSFDSVRIMHAPLAPDDADYDRYLVVDGSYAADSGGLLLGDADLIVTLYRAIDAQLDILDAAIYNIRVSKFGETHATVAAAIRFARAINGGIR